MDQLEHQIETLRLAKSLADTYMWDSAKEELDWIIETALKMSEAMAKGQPTVYIGYTGEVIPKWMAILGAWLEEETDTLNFEGVEVPPRLRGMLHDYFRFDEEAPHERQG